MDREIHEFAGQPRTVERPGPPQDSPPGAAKASSPRIGVIYNPRSHRNQGRDLDCIGRPDVMLAQPREREQIASLLREFADAGIEYLVINGGDGTVRDVLTAGAEVFGDAWPVLAIVPKGKTNALNVDLGAPGNWSLADALDAFGTGRRIKRRPIEVTPLDTARRPMRGFILGAGAFGLGVRAGQDAHAMGFFNSLAVGMTGAWGALQAFFGGADNPWRRGVEMAVRLLPGGHSLAHSGHGNPARREILLASTLERMPMGAKPFGRERGGLKLAVIDHPRRRILIALPAILLGWQPGWLARAGYHQLDAEAFELDVAGPFILDGEAFPAGRYRVAQAPELTFVTT